MVTIHKFNLPIEYQTEIEIPGFLKLLPGVHEQSGLPVIYAIVNPDELAITTISFNVVATGDMRDGNLTSQVYVGTVKIPTDNPWHDNGLMFHVFTPTALTMR